jgi:KDO2-lipid IV(A) lauroyltransferase
MLLRARSLALRALLALLLALPYRLRVPLCGWLMAHLVAPLAGYRRRVRDNLALVLPDLRAAEVRRLQRAVPDNVGRSLIEIFSGADFLARATAGPIDGPGLAALDAAHAAGRPVILVTGHFGNYDAARGSLVARGFRVGALYKPMRDAGFNARYVQAMEAIGRPMFPRGRAGMAAMVRFLRGGGMLAMAIDQHMRHGAPLTFLGVEAATALSAAELALRHDALLVPIYGVRQPDGLSFRVTIEAPVPAGTPEAMTQALNDSLERQVRRHPEQWFWIHRRWKRPRAAG